MDFSWILLALFLVALIRGVSKSLTRSMLKNCLRLGSVVVAFLITFGLQLGGVFQNVVSTITELINLTAMLPGLEGATALINALASTIAGPIFFVIVFFLLLWILRVIIHFVLKAVEKPGKATPIEQKAAEPAPEAAAVQPEPALEVESAPEEAPEIAPEEEKAPEIPAEYCAECEAVSDELNIPAEDQPSAEGVETAEPEACESEEPAPEAEAAPEAAYEAPAEPAPAPEKPKKKKKGLYPECAWKRIVSIATGAISGLLVLAVFLMPLFYYMSIASGITHALDNSDAEDSQIYKVVEVVDDYVVEPYESSFVFKFYDVIGVETLLNYTTKAGGKIQLDNGESAYADDVLKGLLSHGVSAAAQITSLESECLTVRADVEAIVSDPVISSIVADLAMSLIDGVELEPAEEGDLMGELIADFVEYYKNADKATIQRDLSSLGSAVGVLAEEKILLELAGGNADLSTMLENEETLGNVVEAISGLSAFGPTIEGAFELGVEILGETLQIPADDSEAYEIFMDDLTEQMIKDTSTKFDLSTIQYFVYHTERLGVKATSTNGVKGYSQFSAYVKHWQKVQSAFAHASEDKSYGYFTMVINGNTYIYDSESDYIFIFDESNSEIYNKYKDRVSPLAGLINALALRSSTAQLSRDDLYTILTNYVNSANDPVGVELAGRILDKDNFVSGAVTIEKMVASTNFEDWTDEEKANDSRLCVDIIMNLLGIMDSLAGLENTDGIEGATDLVDQFVVLGETMDTMKQTSCINELPPLLMEALVKHDMLSTYIKPSTAFQINNIVENNDRTYADAMTQIAGIIKFAISMSSGVN